jgi:hypothetical protein
MSIELPECKLLGVNKDLRGKRAELQALLRAEGVRMVNDDWYDANSHVQHPTKRLSSSRPGHNAY